MKYGVHGVWGLGYGVRGTGKLVSEYGVWRAVGMYGVADRPGAGIWRFLLDGVFLEYGVTGEPTGDAHTTGAIESPAVVPAAHCTT